MGTVYSMFRIIRMNFNVFIRRNSKMFENKSKTVERKLTILKNRRKYQIKGQKR